MKNKKNIFNFVIFIMFINTSFAKADLAFRDSTILNLSETTYRWNGKHVDSEQWTQSTADGIADYDILNIDTPKDIAEFCPKYKTLSNEQKNMFWIYLVSSMAELESAFKPNSSYTENFNDSSGNKVVSRGLLQLSYESAKNYGCVLSKGTDLFDSDLNLNCGTKILAHWLVRDGRIAGKSGSTWLGAGRYWSIFRHKLSKIQGWTQSIPYCN